jgi:type IV secretory pathway TrbD component
MPDKAQQKRRTNRVFKSLHKPLTYLGVERTLFYFVCVGAVGAFNLFNSILAGIAVFVGGFAFGHWVTNSDPAFLSILAKSERYKPRYDAAKQPTRSRTVSQEPIFRRWHGSGKAPATEIPVNAENVDLSLASSGGDLQCHHSFYRR